MKYASRQTKNKPLFAARQQWDCFEEPCFVTCFCELRRACGARGSRFVVKVWRGRAHDVPLEVGKAAGCSMHGRRLNKGPDNLQLG